MTEIRTHLHSTHTWSNATDFLVHSFCFLVFVLYFLCRVLTHWFSVLFISWRILFYFTTAAVFCNSCICFALHSFNLSTADAFYLLLPISFTFIINPAISSMNVIDLMDHCSSLFTIVHNVNAAAVCSYHLCRQLIIKPSMDTNGFSVSMCYTANTNFWKVNERKPMNIEISRFAILCALAPCIF